MKTELIRQIITIALWSLAAIGVFWTGLQLFGYWHDEWSGWNGSWQISDGECNIAVVPVDGEVTTFPYVKTDDGSEGGENELTPISTSMSDTLGTLGIAERYDQDILGVLMLIDSPGGSPAGSQMIMEEIKHSSLPNAAYILDYGASGGYLIATGADRIFANPYADIGSIGITMSYLDYSRQNAEQGLEYIELASGKFKDSGDPDKPLTAEERVLFERDLKIHHDTFVSEVAENRNLPVETVAQLADGSTLPASLALEKKLIDQIGSKEDVRMWFAEQLDMSPDDIIFCQ